jgi:UDP-N-acetylmuramoylalanine--D-glutamate ligase
VVQTTAILGLGASGLAAAEFLLRQGAQVIGIDSNRSRLETPLKDLGLQCQHDSDPVDWSTIGRLVVSPGVDPKTDIYSQAKKRGVEIVGEAELALPKFKKPLVAVTGTNGKTTVTLMVEHILNSAGIKAKALGNVGTPLCSYLLQPGNEEAFVVELSSYQLETMHTPVFDAAVLLNITPDHLDRYAGMREYAEAKCRLQFLLKRGALLHVQTQAAKEFSPLLLPGNYQTFEMIEDLLPVQYESKHDSENALAAWVLCRGFCISNEQFCKALETFKKPPHRIEFVGEIDGVSYYDDSKGTNIDAVIQAVNAMQGPVILIAGGVDKGGSYLLWKEAFLGKVKKIIAIGEAAPKIYRELHSYYNIKLADSLSSAVEVAAGEAEKGDFVLLSPGCSSFDMFRDYAHRGEEFQRLIEGRRKS